MASSQSEHALILLSAGTAALRNDGAQRSRTLLTDGDWSQLAETLRARRLLPLLGPRILELAGETANPSFAMAVQQSLEMGRRQSAYLQLIALRIMTMLADAGIPSASLKGPLLAEAIYGDPGRRLSSDIDLLVPTEELSNAVELVRRLGYAVPRDYVDSEGLPKLHFLLIHDQQLLPPVELHWRIHWYERRFARDRLLPPSATLSRKWRPEPVDELIALLLFYARDGFIDLRLATDLSAWWDTYGSMVPSPTLAERLNVYPELTRAVLVAARVAESMVGLPASEVLNPTDTIGLRGRVARRLANPNPRSSQSQLYADMGFIDGLLAPSGGFLEFVRRQVLPPRQVLNQQAEHEARGRARSPFARCAGTLARYSMTITRLARTNTRR